MYVAVATVYQVGNNVFISVYVHTVLVKCCVSINVKSIASIIFLEL